VGQTNSADFYRATSSTDNQTATVIHNSPPEFRQKKTAEQAEDSSPSHRYFPVGKFRYPASRRRAPALRSSKYSLLTLLLRLRHPNSKKSSRVFCEILSPKNSFRKTESALVPPPARILGGQNPERKTPFLFQEKIHPRQIRNARSVFSFGVAGVLASAWGFGSFVQFPFKKGSHKVYNYSIKMSEAN
jgi:hypothetical protein